MSNIYKVIEVNAIKINMLHKNIKTTFINRDKDQESYLAWKKACQSFHDEYKLIFPHGWLAKLKAQDPEAIKFAIAFLDIDPIFHRSGYIKEKILHLLKQSKLNAKQKLNLQNIILKKIYKGFSREFKYYARLAQKISSSDFENSLYALSQSEDNNIAKKAKWILNLVCSSNTK